MFREYPDLNKMSVSDKFPMDSRPQFGVIVKNASGESLPLAADNFMSLVVSHCFTANLKGKKGKFLEWVKENDETVTTKVTEDVSSQVTAKNVSFTLSDTPTQGHGNVDAVISVRQVHVTVNGLHARVGSIEGKVVTLEEEPPTNAVVLITYWKRTLTKSGLYYIELVEVDLNGAGQVAVYPLYNESPVIITKALGSETTFTLVDVPVFPNSLELVEIIAGQEVVLNRGIHYTLDEPTGVLTFLPSPENPYQTLRYGATYRVDYRKQGETLGPFPVHRSQSSLDILPGVVLAFGHWFEQGDKLVVIVTDKREPVSQEYGGNFDVSISMEVYSRDPVQREFIADLVAMQFWAVLKPKFDATGLLLKTVSLSGESEDMYDENTDTVYYMAGIDLSITADWRLYLPLVVKLKKFVQDIDLLVSASSFKVSFIPSEEKIL